jgi:hypothetical protein
MSVIQLPTSPSWMDQYFNLKLTYEFQDYHRIVIIPEILFGCRFSVDMIGRSATSDGFSCRISSELTSFILALLMRRFSMQKVETFLAAQRMHSNSL